MKNLLKIVGYLLMFAGVAIIFIRYDVVHNYHGVARIVTGMVVGTIGLILILMNDEEISRY